MNSAQPTSHWARLRGKRAGALAATIQARQPGTGESGATSQSASRSARSSSHGSTTQEASDQTAPQRTMSKGLSRQMTQDLASKKTRKRRSLRGIGENEASSAAQRTRDKGSFRETTGDSETDNKDASASLGFLWSEVLGHQLYHIYCDEDSFVTEELLSTAQTAHALSEDLQLLLFYFSSRWCPICADFDVTMIGVYEGFKAMPNTSVVEIIWVSFDVTEEAYLEHLSELGGMYAVPWQLKRLEWLAELFGVEGLPALVVVDARSGAVLTCWGREDVVAAVNAQQKQAMKKGWIKEPSEDAPIEFRTRGALRKPTLDLATPTEKSEALWDHLLGTDLVEPLFERWHSLLPLVSPPSEGNSLWLLGKVV